MNELPTSKRLEILKASLQKKKELFDRKLQEHFDDVKRANGQPLNDKRNGRTTIDRWDRQNSALRNLEESTEKTKQAIARGEDKIARCQSIKDQLPAPILDSIASGELVQWRKYPNIFFVQGVDKARIIWEKGKVFHKYTNSITDKEQWAKFAGIFNRLAQQINA